MRTIKQVRSSIRRLKSKLAEAERIIAESTPFEIGSNELNVMDLEKIEGGLTFTLNMIDETMEFWRDISETNKRLEGMIQDD